MASPPPRPPARRKGPLNLRVRVKMNIRMQEMWTQELDYSKFRGEKIPPDPPRRSRFRCLHLPNQPMALEMTYRVELIVIMTLLGPHLMNILLYANSQTMQLGAVASWYNPQQRSKTAIFL